MSNNYPARYAAICERWPELRHPDIRFFGENWSLTLVEYNDELDGVVRHASSTPILLTIIRARLEDGLPDDMVLVKDRWGNHKVVRYERVVEYIEQGYSYMQEGYVFSALDALLAWWEGRKG